MKRKQRLHPVFGLLALLLILGALLPSCQSDRENPGDALMATVNLSEYCIVRPDSTSQDCLAAVAELRSALIGIGVTPEVSDDWYREGEYDPTAREILIGNTNRAESADLLSQINGEGYAISFTEHKVVIAATRDGFLSDAVAYFVEHLLQGSVTPTVQLNAPVFSEPYRLLTLAANGKTDYTIIRQTNSSDYTIDLGMQLRESIREYSGAAPSVDLDTFTDATDPQACEILLGHTNRPESAAALEGVPPDGYVVACSGNRIILNAWSLAGIGQAVEAFLDILERNQSGGEISIPAFASEQGSIRPDFENLPEPALTLSSAYRGLHDTLTAVYTGAVASDFEAYLGRLKDAGFSEYQTNRIGNNLFAVYTQENRAVSVSYFPWDGSLRVTSETAAALPAASYTETEAITASTLGQLSLDDEAGNFGMGYIFTLEDGSFFIIDGGGSAGEDETVLYNYLRAHNKRADGQIVIAGWLFTHEHYDHVTNYLDFTARYAGMVTLEAVYWNFADPCEFEGIGSYYSAMLSSFAKYSDVSVYKVHAGQRFWIRNAEVEILYTHETLHPYVLTDMNDTSTVFRVNIAGQRILFLADVSTVAARDSGVKVIYGLYGSELKSDILQVAHHGWNGGSVEIYNAVLPEIALWPVEQSRWDTVTGYPTSKVILQLQEQGIIRFLYVAKDGEVTIELE